MSGKQTPTEINALTFHRQTEKERGRERGGDFFFAPIQPHRLHQGEKKGGGGGSATLFHS